MSVVFSESGKRGKLLSLSIDGYEFDYSPDEITSKTDKYDMNWLTVRIDYSENGKEYTYTDNCLLAFELHELTEDIDKIINGLETGFITENIEPFLRFAVTVAGGIYAVQVRFVYDTSHEWKEIYISQAMTLNELCETNEKLKELSRRFPAKR